MNTKILLKPLQKSTQLKNLKKYRCVGCEHSGNMVSLTFQIDDEDGREVFQDLVFEFYKGKSPKVFVSKSYEL